jgi:hypothetical protein
VFELLFVGSLDRREPHTAPNGIAETGVPYMSLELSGAERDVLLRMLHDQLEELRNQVVYSTVPWFKDQLREREKLVERMIAKCEMTHAA